MNPFAYVEQRLADVVERFFGRVFPSRLEPVEIARRLVSTLEATSPPPTRYRVVVGALDFEMLADESADLVASWQEMLEQMADRLHLPLAEPPVVELAAAENAPPGSVRIEAKPGEAVRRLRVKADGGVSRTLVVFADHIVGRAADAALTLLDPSVSRRHARFTLDEGTLRVVDLASTNGTFVGGRRVTISTLQPGDVVRLGDCELVVE